jgi:hypothetical protein
MVYVSHAGAKVNFHIAMCLSDLHDLPLIGTVRMRVYSPTGRAEAAYFEEIGMELTPIPEPGGLEQLQAHATVIEVTILEAGVYTIEVSSADHDDPSERRRLQFLALDMPNV